MNLEARRMFDEGNLAFERGDLAAAEVCFSRVLAQHRQFPDLYCKLGQIYHQKGRFTDAIKLFAEALRYNPNYVEARVNLLVLLNDLGHYDHAAKLMPKLNSAGVNPGPLHMGRLAKKHLESGDLYYSLQLYEHARVEYEHACKLRPGWADLRTKLGVVYRRLNRAADALRELETAVAINPRYLEARVELAYGYYLQGKTEHAVSLWKAVLTADPGHAKALRYLALAGGKGETAAA